MAFSVIPRSFMKASARSQKDCGAKAIPQYQGFPSGRGDGVGASPDWLRSRERQVSGMEYST